MESGDEDEDQDFYNFFESEFSDLTDDEEGSYSTLNSGSLYQLEELTDDEVDEDLEVDDEADEKMARYLQVVGEEELNFDEILETPSTSNNCVFSGIFHVRRTLFPSTDESSDEPD